jgi:hypothetical protein
MTGSILRSAYSAVAAAKSILRSTTKDELEKT